MAHRALRARGEQAPEITPREHEQRWERYGEMLREFVALQLEIRAYLAVLATIADIGEPDR